MEEKRRRWQGWLSQSEGPMLILALCAVALYMAELLGVWHEAGWEGKYYALMIAIDLVFAFNLFAKIALLRWDYINNPWFIVDVVSTLPILSTVAFLPESMQGLRFLRGLRLFRALRGLRMLNVITTIQGSLIANDVETKEMNKLRWALRLSVSIYTVVFLIVIDRVYKYYGAMAPLIEFYIIFGNIFGLMIAVTISRFQIPAIISAQISGLLNVALPFQVAKHFIKHPEAYARTVRMPASILFCDIKGFTTTVKILEHDLQAVKDHLEQVMTAVTEVHKKYDLIIDKFIGDAVMSFRGGDLVSGTPEQHAWRTVMAAIESYKAVRSLKDPYFSDIKIGGASAEAALIGAFGTASRLSYTILGDRVNLAARLEAAVKQCGTENLFCDITYELLKEHHDIIWRCFGKIMVEGRSVPLNVYEAYAADDLDDTLWIAEYHSALSDFQNRMFNQAQEKFKRVIAMRPGGDFPSKLYISQCQLLIENPPNLAWEPIFMTKK